MGTTKLRGKRVGKSPLQLQSGQISGVEMNDEQRERDGEGEKMKERERQRGRKGRREKGGRETERKGRERVRFW